MSKTIQQLNPADPISREDTLVEIQQTDLTPTTQSRKLTLRELQNLILPAGFLGEFGGLTAPDGWLLCDGSPVSRTTYADLFAAIGTTWGAGDGSTTFNVPDLRGAFLRGTGSHGSETMADGSAFAGPAVGAFENDQFQGHWHKVNRYLEATSDQVSGNTIGVSDGPLNNESSRWEARRIVTDTTNGTPRIGDETRPFAAGVLICIKT
jgi:microcystin-dependent protein